MCTCVMYMYMCCYVRMCTLVIHLYCTYIQYIPYHCTSVVLGVQIAGVNYGGHVTDDFDRRVLHTYINEYYNDITLETPYFK